MLPQRTGMSHAAASSIRVREYARVTKTETTPSFAARKRLDPLRDGIDRRDAQQQSESGANYMCILLLLHIGVATPLLAF